MKTQPSSLLPVVLGTVIVQIGLGTIYTWSLFNQPLASKFGWPISSVALTFSITSFALAVSTLVAGRLQEAWGLRNLVTAAGLVLGAGLMLSSRVASLPLLYVLAGGVVGYADGTAYVTTLSNLIKWFPGRKGLISGVCVSAYGLGSLIFKYVFAALIGAFGVSAAFLYWGIIALVLIVVASRLLQEAHPAATLRETEHDARHDYTVAEMMRTREVYFLFIMFFTACMSGLYLISIVKDIGVQLAGLSAAVAANAVAAIAVFNTLGRLILGALSDQVGRLRVVTFTFLLTAGAVLKLSGPNLTYSGFFLSVASIAFCFGGNITVFPAIVGDFFGLKHHSKCYGIVYQGFGLGALAGSFVAALLGGFKPTFLVMSTLCALSAIIAVLIRPPGQHAHPDGDRPEKEKREGNYVPAPYVR